MPAAARLPSPPAWDQVVHQGWPLDRPLPWGHLQAALPAATLQRHRQEALEYP
jgi:hypothetical protein